MMTVNMDKNLIEKNIRTSKTMTESQFFNTLAKAIEKISDDDDFIDIYGSFDKCDNENELLPASTEHNYTYYLNDYLFDMLHGLIYYSDDNNTVYKDFKRVRANQNNMYYEFRNLKNGLPAIITFTDSTNNRPCIGIIYAEDTDTLRGYIPLYANSFNRNTMCGFNKDIDSDDKFIAKENGCNQTKNMFEQLEQNVLTYIDDVLEGINAAITVI